MDELIGQQLGIYTIERKLGRGGMASVFLAHDPTMERQVAIKILPREFANDPMYVERFKREVKVIAKLNHPNIVPVHAFGETDGWTYIVMAHMSGGTLAGHIRKMGNTIPLETIASYTEQIASAMDYAHSMGVIHRDFKPANVLMGDRGHPALSDFGIAKVTESTAQLTGTGMLGTPAYMAPELAAKGGLTSLVDIYALGVTLYEMVTGQVPYEADTPMGLLMAHMATPVPDARYLRHEIPEPVQAALAKGMAKDPAQRYQTAMELAQDFREAIGLSATTAVSAPTPAAAEEYDDGLHTVQTPPPPRQTPSGPIAQPMTMPASARPQASKPRIGIGLLAGGAVGLVVVVVAALALTGVVPLFGPSALEATATPAEQPTATTEVTEAPAVSFQPVAKPLFGDVEAKAADAADFAPLTADTPLAVGAVVRAGPNAAAVLVFAEGVSVEVHPNSLVTIQRLEAVGDTLFVELKQDAGTTYHFIGPSADGLKRDYTVISPRGVTKAVGTQFWVSESKEGWYYIPTDGVIKHDLHDPNNDDSDQYEEYASKNDCLLVDADFKVSNCALPGGLALLTDGQGGLAATPTPTVVVVQGGEEPSATPVEPTATQLTVIEQCGPGWLPSGGCQCCGTTLVCADGSVAEFNPQCGIGGSGPPTSAPGCTSCGASWYYYNSGNCGPGSACFVNCEYWKQNLDTCGNPCGSPSYAFCG